MSTKRAKNQPKRGTLTRRRFCQSAAMGLGGLAVGYLAPARGLAKPCYANTGRGLLLEGEGPMLPPIVTGRSVEICLNSRISSHGGLTGTATDQQLANVMWAAGKAPYVGRYRTIYLKTPKATYTYNPADHSLKLYSSGTVTNAFRINYDRELDFDAGVSYVLALWASVSLWTGTSGQVTSCPQMSDLNFGIGTVPGLTSQLVAISSDGSLPNPVTDGPVKYETLLPYLKLSSKFRTGAGTDLTPQQLSQILWAGYGCSAHMTTNGRAGLTVPSWIAQYFLTNRIYVVGPRVWRYCCRRGSDPATRDHRLELVHDADVRDAVRQALPGIPAAPCYVLLCLTESGLGVWYQKLETGFAAGGLLLQSRAMGLGCAFKAALSTTEQQSLQQIAHVPATDFAHAVVAVGRQPGDLNCDGNVDFADINPFVQAISDPEEYRRQYPNCDLLNGDLNGDGNVDFGDINPFVELLSGQ